MLFNHPVKPRLTTGKALHCFIFVYVYGQAIDYKSGLRIGFFGGKIQGFKLIIYK